MAKKLKLSKWEIIDEETPEYPNGGRAPIVGTPQQYQAYKDSLDAHNRGLLDLRAMRMVQPNAKETPIGINEAKKRFGSDWGAAEENNYKGISPVGQILFGDDGSVGGVNVYAKPVQPIINPKTNILPQVAITAPKIHNTLYDDSLALYNASEKYNKEISHIKEASKTDAEYISKMEDKTIKQLRNTIDSIWNKHPSWKPISNIDPGIWTEPDGHSRRMENIIKFQKPTNPIPKKNKTIIEGIDGRRGTETEIRNGRRYVFVDNIETPWANDWVLAKENIQPLNTQTSLIPSTQLNINPEKTSFIPENSYFTRPKQSQELGDLQYFDKKTGKELKNEAPRIKPIMRNGGKLPKYDGGGKTKKYTNKDEYLKAKQSYDDSLAYYKYYQLQKQNEFENKPGLFERFMQLGNDVIWNPINYLSGIIAPEQRKKEEKEFADWNVRSFDFFRELDVARAKGDIDLAKKVIHKYGYDDAPQRKEFWEKEFTKPLPQERLQDIQGLWNSDSFDKSPYKNFEDFKQKQQVLWNYGDSLIAKNPNFRWSNSGNSPDLVHRNIDPTGQWRGLAYNYSMMVPPSVEPIYIEPNPDKKVETSNKPKITLKPEQTQKPIQQTQPIIKQEPPKQVNQYTKIVDGKRVPITKEEFDSIAKGQKSQPTGYQLKDKNVQVVPLKKKFGGSIKSKWEIVEDELPKAGNGARTLEQNPNEVGENIDPRSIPYVEKSEFKPQTTLGSIASRLRKDYTEARGIPSLLREATGLPSLMRLPASVQKAFANNPNNTTTDKIMNQVDMWGNAFGALPIIGAAEKELSSIPKIAQKFEKPLTDSRFIDTEKLIARDKQGNIVYQIDPADYDNFSSKALYEQALKDKYDYLKNNPIKVNPEDRAISELITPASFGKQPLLGGNNLWNTYDWNRFEDYGIKPKDTDFFEIPKTDLKWRTRMHEPLHNEGLPPEFQYSKSLEDKNNWFNKAKDRDFVMEMGKTHGYNLKISDVKNLSDEEVSKIANNIKATMKQIAKNREAKVFKAPKYTGSQAYQSMSVNKFGGKVKTKWEIIEDELPKAGNGLEQFAQYPSSSDKNINLQTRAKIQDEQSQQALIDKQKHQQAVNVAKKINVGRNPLKGTATPQEKQTISANTKDSPYNPLFAPYLVPNLGDQNDPRVFEAQKYLGQQNALDMAGNTLGVIPDFITPSLNSIKMEVNNIKYPAGTVKGDYYRTYGTTNFPESFKNTKSYSYHNSTGKDLFNEYKKGAETLNQSVNTKVDELLSNEGFYRLYNQELDFINKNTPYIKNAEEEARLRAQHRIAELNNFTNKNKILVENITDRLTPSQIEKVNSALYRYEVPIFNAHAQSYNKGDQFFYPNTSNFGENSMFINTGSNYYPPDLTLGYGLGNSSETAFHEINHALQKNRVLPIDEELRQLRIRKDISDNLKEDADYFLTGSRGQEPSSFLAEARELMKKHGFIKNTYDDITPEIVEKAHKYFIKNPQLTHYKEIKRLGNDHRIFDFMEGSKDNYQLLAKAFNKLPAVVPALVAAKTIRDQKKLGGRIKNQMGNNRLN